MRFSLNQAMLVSLLAASTGNVMAHPSAAVLAKFSPHFRCPYANEWVSKGPQQAALDLGLLNATKSSAAGSVRRRAQENVAGSCSYTNTWTNQQACIEFRGEAWTEASMGERCGGETDSTMTMAQPCAVGPSLGGYCIVGEGASIEANPMSLTPQMDCDMAQTACQNFMGGTFTASDACTEGGAPPADAEGGGFPFAVEAPSEPVSCAIAPGKFDFS